MVHRSAAVSDHRILDDPDMVISVDSGGNKLSEMSASPVSMDHRYRRHEPEKTALYLLSDSTWAATFSVTADETTPIPGGTGAKHHT
jgi:hypothetical protein